VKVVSNKTNRPIKISLPGGKLLHLGPFKTGQIADNAAERPAVKKLLESGEIEILGEGEHPQESTDSGGAPHESRRGHPQNTSLRSKGDR
jgi:hypothetical protein